MESLPAGYQQRNAPLGPWSFTRKLCKRVPRQRARSGVHVVHVFHNKSGDRFEETFAMIDHTGVTVSDFGTSKAFYTRALAPIGYELIMELPAAVTGHADVAGFGAPPKPDFWIAAGTPNVPPVHVAFRVASRAMVDAFHKAALAAGGRDNRTPGLRPHYHPNYYGAFVLDPDGHNIEAVCHEAP